MSRLFWKFFFAFLTALLLVSIAVGSSIWLRQAAKLDAINELPLKLGRDPAAVVSVAANLADYGGRETLRQYLTDQIAGEEPLVYAVDHAGNELLGRPTESTTHATARELMQEYRRIRSIRQIRLDDGEDILLFVPRTADNAAFNFEGKKTLAPPMWLLASLSLLVSLLFSALLAWYFTRPIRKLRQAFNAVAAGDLGTRVSADMQSRQDELADLGKSFDQMTEQLGQLVNAQQQLLHDVSHELRSPLARMQAAIGIAQQRPEKIPESLARVEQESVRIDMLIGDLLKLSRLESLYQAKTPQRFDLLQLLQQVLTDARYEAQQRQITIDFQSPATSLTYFGQPELLHRAVENVLRNAVRFSPDNSTISLLLEQSVQYFTISVRDQGPGVDDNLLEAIFKPFYRGSSQREGSTGLGLTIANRAIAAHHGFITAKNHAEGGLVVTIQLPCDQKSP